MPRVINTVPAKIEMDPFPAVGKNGTMGNKNIMMNGNINGSMNKMHVMTSNKMKNIAIS